MMSMNVMMSLLMPIWNLMTYPKMGNVCPSVPTTQIHVNIPILINAHKPIL
jgi:hypothetical protein